MNFNLTELIIVLAAKGQRPNVINVEFLKYSGIVPTDWELARQPIYSNQLVQISFTNSITFTAEPGRLIIGEMIEGKKQEEILSAGIARKYIEVLPRMEYQAVGINPRGYLSMNEKQTTAAQYFKEKLLAPGSWQEYGSQGIKANLNLMYTLEQGNMHLSISEAQVKRGEKEVESVVLFSGNFEHIVSKESEQERVLEVQQYLSSWQADFQAYQELIESRFAPGKEEFASVF